MKISCEKFLRYGLLMMIGLAFSMGFPSQGFGAGLQKVGYKANPAGACDEAEFGRFGNAIALGDLNGDGLDDLIVLRRTTYPGKDERIVIYYSKGGNNPFDDPPVILDFVQAGISVTTADVKADGIKDLVISSEYGLDVFYGKPTKFNSSDSPDWSYSGLSGPFNDVSIMDGNADGIDDILLGARHSNKGYVFYGSASGLPADHQFDAIIEGSDVLGWGYQTESGVQYNYWIAGVGAAVAPDGEACGSGTNCMIQYAIGAPNTQIDFNKNGVITENENNIGAVMVGPRTQFLSCDKQSWTFCGYALGNAGDVNGDGQTDLIVSAQPKNLGGGSILPPKVFVYLGKDPSSFGRMNTAYSWAVEEPQPRNPVGPGFMTFGYKVGSAGDINGDGYGDIFTTDYRYDTTGTNRNQAEGGYWGRVYIWFGGPPSVGDPSGLGLNPTPGTADIKLNGEAISGGFGEAVAVGDINGDGVTDVVVGDPRGGAWCWDYNLNQSRFAEVGLVWVYLSSFPLLNRSELAIDMGSSGLWKFDGTNWTKLAWQNAEAMAQWGNGLAADFGSAGLWYYDGANWEQIAWQNVEGFVEWKNGLAIDLGPSGLWNYNGTNWTKLAWQNVEGMARWGNGLAVDMGSEGLWYYIGTSWIKVAWQNVEGFVEWKNGLAIDLGPSGLWNYVGTTWTKLAWQNVETMARWGNGLAVDLGGGGLWRYDGTTWTQIAWQNPEGFVEWKNGLAIDLGSSGLWNYDGTNWTKLAWQNVDACESVNLH